jgi:hypothetical protein
MACHVALGVSGPLATVEKATYQALGFTKDVREFKTCFTDGWRVNERTDLWHVCHKDGVEPGYVNGRK